MRRRAVGTALVRTAGAAALAAAVGHGVPVARAWDEWCDSDPLLVIRTPEGRLVTVYCLIGVSGPTEVVAGLVGNLTPASTVAPAGKQTRVTVTATVPCGGGHGFRTRMKVTSKALGMGTVYGETTGTCGDPMAVSFLLPVP
jgi:hypothetical protein